MGSIVRTVFGGGSSKNSSSSTQESVSENQAYPTLLGLLKGGVGQGGGAMSTLGSLLGFGDPAAGQSTLTNFLDSTGFNFLKDQGQRAITGSRASKGILNSGASAKALTTFNQDLASTKLNELFKNLTSLGEYGLGSANVISSAGQRSTSTGTSTATGKSVDNGKGIFNSLFPGGLSDPRLKSRITLLGTNEQGVGVYSFKFNGLRGLHVGVISTEIAIKLPEALGPLLDGYRTVDYSKITPLKDHPFTEPVKEVPVNG